MSEIFKKWLQLTSVPGANIEEVVDFHQRHKAEILKELRESWSSPEATAAFQAEVDRIRSASRGGAQ